jgi:hypothetical protein
MDAARLGAGQQQQPDTRQARSREAGTGVEPRSPTLATLQIGAGEVAARPAAIEPTNSAPNRL